MQVTVRQFVLFFIFTLAVSALSAYLDLMDDAVRGYYNSVKNALVGMLLVDLCTRDRRWRWK
jgi:hypothetical protein